MKNRHRVVWTKGMFLTPQHFQTQDRFFQDALQFRFTASNYSNWGVTKLDIDSESLENGTFRVNQCSGIMPDGEPFDIPDVDELPASRPVADHFPPSRDSLNVFLAIPEVRPRARNVSIEESSDLESPKAPPTTRYVAETLMVTDDNAGDEERPVQVARRTFRLLFEDEYRDGYSTLHIAQVSRSATGSPILSPRFVAPCLDLASSDYLSCRWLRQMEIFGTKIAALPDSAGNRGRVLAEFFRPKKFNFGCCIQST